MRGIESRGLSISSTSSSDPYRGSTNTFTQTRLRAGDEEEERQNIMNKSDIEHLYRYNRWANAQTLISASRLNEEQFTRDLASSHASVRDTLAHIMAAEWMGGVAGR